MFSSLLMLTITTGCPNIPPLRLRGLGKESKGISSRFGSQKKSPRCMSLRARHGVLALTLSKIRLGDEAGEWESLRLQGPDMSRPVEEEEELVKDMVN